jgi:outer membrane protein assembly factor BamB
MTATQWLAVVTAVVCISQPQLFGQRSGTPPSSAVARATPPAPAATDQWPQFRGTQAGVVDDDPILPETWSETDNVAWKTDIPGLGWSSPVVWNDHIFVTSAVSTGQEVAPIKGLYDPNAQYGKTKSTAVQRWVVHDVDWATGKIRWTRELRTAVPPILRHLKNSFSSETPVTDGERVYVYFGSAGLVAALDFTGKTVWSTELETLNGRQEFGTASSPVVYQDRLFIMNDNRTQSFLMALDKRTGKQLWKVPRDEVENWSTPLIWVNEARTELVTTGVNKVRSYDLDGHLLWELTGMTSVNNVPSPFTRHGLLYINSGYPGSALRPVYAIRPGASGDISLKPGETSNQYIAWSHPLLGTYTTSSLVYGDHYYTLLDRGFLLCHDARTGQQLYGRQRIAVDASGFSASPWAYNGKVFLLSEDGDTYVVQAGPEYKLLGKNSLNEMSLATPAIARGSLIIRTQSHLYRIARAGQ